MGYVRGTRLVETPIEAPLWCQPLSPLRRLRRQRGAETPHASILLSAGLPQQIRIDLAFTSVPKALQVKGREVGVSQQNDVLYEIYIVRTCRT